MSQPGSDTVTEVFVSASGDIYRHISYCQHPTVCIENVMTGERQTHVVDCLNIKGMKLEKTDELEYHDLVDLITRLANHSASQVQHKATGE